MFRVTRIGNPDEVTVAETVLSPSETQYPDDGDRLNVMVLFSTPRVVTEVLRVPEVFVILLNPIRQIP
jgi:hypothetical protein